jgi:PAS domain S-box-containing protein
MISILYVDDDPALLSICRIFLERAGDFRVDTLESAVEIPRIIKEKQYDAIISDYQMPEMDGITLLKTIRAGGSGIPFVLFTGRGREEVVIEALNNGADFYLQKGGAPKAQFAELAHKVRQAVGKQKTEEELRASEKRLSDIINFLPDPTFAIDRDRKVIAWNRAMEDLTGAGAAEMIGKGKQEYSIPLYGRCRPLLIDLIFEPEDRIAQQYYGIIRQNDVLIAEADLPDLKGSPRIIMGKASPLYSPDGEIIGSIESIRDITSIKKAERELRSAYEEIAAAEEELRGQFDALAQNERSLRESEARFRQLSETMTAGIFVFRKKILYANPAAEILTGFSRDELLSMDFWEFVHPDFRNKVKNKGILMPDSAKNPSHNTFKIIRKNGEERWVDASTTQILYDGIPAVISIHVDMTEEKQVMDRLFSMYQAFHQFGSDPRKNIGIITALAGEKLQGAAAFYCRLEKNSPRCVGQWNFPGDRDERERLINRVCAEISVCGEDAEIVITDPSRPDSTAEEAGSGKSAFATCVAKAVRIGEDYYGVLSVLFRNAVVLKEPDLEYLAILANAAAIEDERWLTHESLSDSMEKYRGLFELGSEAIFLIDNETDRLLEANEAATEIYGFSHEELLRMKIGDLLAEPEKTGAVTKKSGFGSIAVSLSYHKKKDGTVFPVEINGRFFVWAGKQVHVVAIHDITSRRQADEALCRANRKLNLLNSITRHDVANQLTVLQGYSQLALLKEPDPVIADFLAKIESVSETIERQITFTGMYQELGVQAPDWHNLHEVLSRVRPKEILFSCSCGNLAIYADPMLEKVFANLFDNAMRHGEHVSQIRIHCERAGEELVIFVEDNGVGVPLNIKPKIFLKGFGKHTGFGLFLVREILAITGISIHETGRHGTGARFEITVPKGGFREETGSRN